MKIAFIAFCRVAGVMLSLLFWFVPGFRYGLRLFREKHADTQFMLNTSIAGALFALSIAAIAYLCDNRFGGPFIMALGILYVLFGATHIKRVFRLNKEGIWLDGPEKLRPLTA